MIYRTHKVRLYPNKKQETYLKQCCGTARFAYNWGLNRWQEMYEAYKEDPDNNPLPNWYKVNKELNAAKHTEFPWMLNVTKHASHHALVDLGAAFDGFFKGYNNYPKFRRKNDHDSFYVGYSCNDTFKAKGNRIWMPCMSRFFGRKRKLGWIRMAEPLRYHNAKVLHSVVSRTGDQWFIAITCELPDPEKPTLPDNPNVVGIDLGLSEYVTSDGRFIKVPKPLRKSQRKMRKAQQSLSRKKKDSKNRAKQKAKVAKIYQRVVNKRKDWLHKLSNEMTSTHDIVVLEDLDVRKMQKNRRLVRSLEDASFAEFRRQVEYKSEVNNCKAVIANRWYPSSKTCSNCGSVKTKLSLYQRTYVCDECGFTCHRDLNAAINLRNLAVSSTVTACGEFSASAHDPCHCASSLDEAGREQCAECKLRCA